MRLSKFLQYGAIEALDRELLLASVLKKGRTFLLAHPEYELTPTQARRFQQFVERREQHEPLAYIIGEKEFFGLPFLVNRFTLIPRPETEFLVEDVLAFLKKKKSNKRVAIVDAGTGSGSIIVSMAKHISLRQSFSRHFSFFAVDTSLRALQVAKKNAKRHKVDKLIQFFQSDCLAQVKKKLSRFDELLILANLPYLSKELYQNTDPTVQNFEPKSALLSGKDGLDHYRRLLLELQTLSPGKKINFWLEISPEQASLLENILPSFGTKSHVILPDLTGRDRIVRGCF